MRAAVLPGPVCCRVLHAVCMLRKGRRTVLGRSTVTVCCAAPCVVQDGSLSVAALRPTIRTMYSCVWWWHVCIVCCRHARLLHLRGRCIPNTMPAPLYLPSFLAAATLAGWPVLGVLQEVCQARVVGIKAASDEVTTP